METINQIQQNLLLQKLIEAYSAKKEFNNSFSMRAFSKRIGVSSGALTEIFQNKRRVTITTAKKILSNLNYSPIEIEDFFQAKKHNNKKRDFKDLTIDQYEVLSNWQYLALLNLLELPEGDHSAEALAIRLGLPTKKIQEYLERLLKLEMIEGEGERYKRTFVRYQTSEDISNSAIKKYHRETLALSEVALREIEPELRDFSSIVIKMNLKNIKKIKKLIREFQDEVSELVENDSPEDICHLNVHLYPVTKNNKKINNLGA
jgi:uncharacterized protein (TIGR02147 family)